MELIMPDFINDDGLPDDDEELSDDDYGFIIGPNGELKSVLCPEDFQGELPETVQLILKIFGIDDIETLENRILH